MDKLRNVKADINALRANLDQVGIIMTLAEAIARADL